MILEINGLTVDCIIGDLPEERTHAQRVRVDVAMEIDDLAGESDALADTVDYAETARRIRVALITRAPKMLECAAKVVCTAVLEDAKVRHAKVKVTKFGAIPGLESASVTYDGGR